MKASERFPRKRRKGPSSVDFWKAESFKARDIRSRYQRSLDTIASGNLQAIANLGAYLAQEIAEGTCAYPNLSALMLEELRMAYAFFVSGAMPAEAQA